MLIMFLHVSQYKDKLRRQPFVFISTQKGVWIVQFKYCTKMSQNYWGCSRTRYVTPDKHIIKILTQTKEVFSVNGGDTTHQQWSRAEQSTCLSTTSHCYSIHSLLLVCHSLHWELVITANSSTTPSRHVSQRIDLIGHLLGSEVGLAIRNRLS